MLDFDGVLVDSYSCLPRVYERIAKCLGLVGRVVGDFVGRALDYEDFYDFLDICDRLVWWPDLLKEFGLEVGREVLSEVLDLFWKERIEGSSLLEGVEEALNCFRKMGLHLVLMAGSDGLNSMKKRRVRESELEKYFEEIVILGEDIEDRISGIRYLLSKYSVPEENVVLVDDKPAPINEVSETFGKIMAVKVEFRGPLKLAWLGECRARLRIKSLKELVKVL